MGKIDRSHFLGAVALRWVWVLGLVVLAGCSEDDAATEPDASTQTSYERCINECSAANPAGTDLFSNFNTCIDNACGNLDPDSEEWGACFFGSFAPGNPEATCRVETDACFNGPVQGCNELIELAEANCAPASVPMSDEEMDGATWCVINQGWLAEPEAQALAWSLLSCVTGLTGGEGCFTECRNGVEACRTCAESRCSSEYSACVADTAPAPADLNPAAAPAACQAIMNCSMQCDTQ